MPSYRASTNIDTSRLQPVRTEGTAMQTVGPTGGDTSTRSRFLDSSLPVRASGSDIYVRQFYNQGGLPQRRFLPVGVS